MIINRMSPITRAEQMAILNSPEYKAFKETCKRVDKSQSLSAELQREDLKRNPKARLRTLERIEKTQQLVEQEKARRETERRIEHAERLMQDVNAETQKRIDHVSDLIEQENQRRIDYVNRLVDETKPAQMEAMSEYLNAKYGPRKFNV